ncbi:MAG: hypothetical protein LGR52_04820, partial [Candidatus Thiosymbion ectosymbiont of Robbea hypermnestra]|nr:hypothetical protein [Candidatus Thiosymbion ectosymbiont of Robbea hypermnestra]
SRRTDTDESAASGYPARRPGPKSMPIPAVPSSAASGRGLVDAIRLPEARLNLLFAALLTTTGGGFLGGNLLLLDAAVFERSGLIALACLAVLAIFYTLARSLGSPIWGLALTYLLLWAMTYARQPWLTALVYACAACALLYTLRFLRVSRRHWGMVLLMGIIGAATAFAATQTQIRFDVLQRLHAGRITYDLLHHAALAAMIKNYGVVSTGLHGLVETPYHVFSHSLMAGLGRLSGCGTLEVYGVAKPVLFIPLLIFSPVAGAALLDRTGRLDLPVAWGLVCLLLVGTPRLLSPWLFWESYFISESYLVALGLFLLGFPLLFKTRLRVSDLLLITLATALMAETKISVGLLFAGLWLVRLLWIPGERPALERIAALAALVTAAVVTARAIGAMSGWLLVGPHNLQTLLLTFIRAFPFGDAWISAVIEALRAGNDMPWRILGLALLVTASFLILYFSLSWLLIGRAVYRQGITALWKDPVALYSSATVISGVSIVSLFYLPGAAAFYFSHIAFFVALPTVVTLATERLHQRRVRDTTLLFLGIALIVLASLKSYYRASALTSLQQPSEQSPLIESLLRVRDRSPLWIALKPDPSLPKNNPVARCDAQPFVFPAVSERPWLQVIPERDDCYYLYYGYAQYGITDARQSVSVKARLLPDMEVHQWSP